MDANTRKNLDAIGRSEYRAIQALLAAYDAAVAAYDPRELGPRAPDKDRPIGAAEDAILESPLSVEVRSGWYTAPPAEDDADRAAEYRIMLAWGGPAARIVGTLDIHGQPESATLEVQDWGTPWTEYTAEDPEILLRYAQFFYYGG
jgi:hypothetical protein